MMDLVIRAPRRPSAGETVIGTSFERFLGGKGFNQAVAAARAGAETVMLGRLGADDFGEQFVASLAAEAIDTSGVIVDADEGTGIGVPLVEDGGENSIVVVPRANARMTVADVEAARVAISESAVLLLQLELPIESALAAARCAREGGVTVVLNPAPAVSDLSSFAGLVDVLVPNQAEASQLTAMNDGEDPSAIGLDLRERTGADVVLTLGSQGAIVIDDHGWALLEPHTVDVVDTVGAGDAFCGTLGAWLARGVPLREAAVYANAAGALAVTQAGAGPSMPTYDAVATLLGGRRPSER